MATIIVRKPIDVTNRLAELGWSADDLLEVTSAMVRARNGCTPNHPSSAPGWFAWAEGTSRIREFGLRKGLVREDVDGIPWVVDKKRGIRFTVANTDDGTGIEGRIPQQRSRKGPSTDRAVDRNQTSIFDFLPEGPVVPLSRVRSHPGIMVSWYACTYCEGDIVRAELSYPIGMEGGLFVDFAERIFLISGDHDDDLVKRKGDDGDGGSDFEINVTRRK